MNDNYGISALDPTVGLLRKELEANNVPQGQEANYFQSKGRPLSPQLVFLIQANQQLQRDAQQSQPPQSTVADDLSSALVQKANQGAAAMMPPPIPPQMPPQMPMMPVDPRAQGVAGLPAPNVGNAQNYAGGGIVAFAGGGSGVMEQLEMFDDLPPQQQSRLLEWAKRNMSAPTFRRWASGIKSLAPKAGGMALKGMRKAPYLGAALGGYDISMADPEDIQATSRLAQMGMDVNPNNPFKTGLAGVMSLAESVLPTSLFYQTPADKARAATEARLKKIAGDPDDMGLNASPALREKLAQRAELVKQFGENSEQVQAFDAQLRAIMGNVAEQSPPPEAPPVAPAAPGSGSASRSVSASATTRPAPAPVDPDIQRYRDFVLGQLNGTDEQAIAAGQRRRQLTGEADVAEERKRLMEARMAGISNEAAAAAAAKKDDLRRAMGLASFGAVGRGRNLLQTLGMIGAGYGERAIEVEDKYRTKAEERQKLQQSYEEAQLKLREADAAAKAGDIATADTKRTEANKILYDIARKTEDVDLRKEQLAINARQVAAQERAMSQAQSARAANPEQIMFQFLNIANDPSRSPAEREAAMARFRALIAGVSEMKVGTAPSVATARAREIAKIKMLPGYFKAKTDAERQAFINRELSLLQLGSSGAIPADDGLDDEESNPYAGFSATPIP